MKKQIVIVAVMLFVTTMAMAGCVIDKQRNNNERAVNDSDAVGQNDDKQNMAPDFTLEDINGKNFSFSSLRGKIVVVDFWGSWCGWCIKGMPEMKKYYDKYRGQLEIVGVDCGDTQEKWKAAVKDLGLPWIHVYNPKGLGDITPKYDIQGFPTKIIVGKKGEVLKVVIGEDPEFYSSLDEIMKK